MNPVIGGKYKHFKGNVYKVIGIGKHTETMEEFVVYKSLNKNKSKNSMLWIRPKKMFLEKAIVNGKKIPRFRFISK